MRTELVTQKTLFEGKESSMPTSEFFDKFPWAKNFIDTTLAYSHEVDAIPEIVLYKPRTVRLRNGHLDLSASEMIWLVDADGMLMSSERNIYRNWFPFPFRGKKKLTTHMEGIVNCQETVGDVVNRLGTVSEKTCFLLSWSRHTGTAIMYTLPNKGCLSEWYREERYREQQMFLRFAEHAYFLE